MNCEAYRPILSAPTQPDVAKLIGDPFAVQMENNPEATAKERQEFLKAKTWDILQWASQWLDLNPTKRAFQLLKTRLKAESPTNMQELAALKACQTIDVA